MKIVWSILLSLGVVLLRLFVLMKIYALTLVKHLSAPALSYWQLFALLYFISAVVDDGKTSSEDLEEAIKTKIVHALALLLIWGIAALIF